MITVNKFTDTFVKKLKPKETRTEYTEGNDFNLRVTPKGVKTWVYSYKLNSKSRRLTIGRYPEKSVADARALVAAAQLLKSQGTDPVQNSINISSENEEKESHLITLKHYLNNEYKGHMQQQASAHKIYLALVYNHFPTLLNKLLKDISKKDLQNWLTFQMEKYNDNKRGYSSSSIKHRYSVFKTLMAYAVNNEVIKKSPFDSMNKLTFPRDESTAQQAKRTYLPLDQQKSFLKSIDNYDKLLRTQKKYIRYHDQSGVPDLSELAFVSHHKPMLLIHYYMGLRGGDVRTLDWAHIIQTPTSANISKVLEKTKRKIPTPTVLPIPRQLNEALKKWKVQQGNPSIGLVFPSLITGGLLSEKCLKDSWDWIKDDAGLHKDLDLYALRHNFISWLIMNGEPLSVVAQLAGHQSTRMIEEYYGHLCPSITKEASTGFSNLLN